MVEHYLDTVGVTGSNPVSRILRGSDVLHLCVAMNQTFKTIAEQAVTRRADDIERAKARCLPATRGPVMAPTFMIILLPWRAVRIPARFAIGAPTPADKSEGAQSKATIAGPNFSPTGARSRSILVKQGKNPAFADSMAGQLVRQCLSSMLAQ